MKNYKKKKEHGFTLIEMMIVLVIISILLLIAIPGLTKNQEIANEKGCEATKKLIKTQMIAYEIEKGTVINTNEGLVLLETEKYIDTLKCPNGKEIIYTDLYPDKENGS